MLFGLSGFVIGPIIAALFITVWEMFVEEFGGLDNTVPMPDPSDEEAEPPEVVVVNVEAEEGRP